MLDFNFLNPVKIIFGKGKIARLSKEILRKHKILMVYGGGSIKRNGVYQQVREALIEHQIVEFPGVESNPKYETLVKGIELVRKEKIDFILAVGGGSVIDGSKFIAAGAFYDKDPWDIVSKHAKIQKALPLGTVLTLPATGSEMNANSVISRRDSQEKLAFHSVHIFPQFSILDPSVTFSLPSEQIANGVVDAFVHVMEQYLTYPVNAPLQDRMAEAILITLMEEGPKALLSPQDYDTRANIMWSATMALNHLIGVGVPSDWSTHTMSHELTASCGLDHARSLAIIFPSLVYFQRKEKRAKILQYAERVLRLPFPSISSDGDQDKMDSIVELAIERTRQFFEGMGIKTRLRDYAINESAIPSLLEKLEGHGMVKLGERGSITLDTCKQILERSL
ncbi:MAG: iron-containing alcohol dehydrogenase [Oligoflexia bacterium]|nr:iron-containing alcohol dehydrogenase [Oligoflexia bacterium]